MSKLDARSEKHFPWIIVLAFFFALAFVLLFENPLEYLRDLFVTRYFESSAVLYTVILSISVVLSPFTIAPAVPFVAKVLGPSATFILTIIGWTIGSSVAFLLARYGGRFPVSKVYPIKRLEKNEYNLSRSPRWLRLLQTRFFAAQDYFSYYLGLSSDISYVRFLIISLLGSIPAAFIFSYSADAIADNDIYTLFVLLFATGLIALSYASFKGITSTKQTSRIYTDIKSMRAGEILATAALILFIESQDKRFILKRNDLSKNIKKIEKESQKKEIFIISQENICPENAMCFFREKEGKRGNNIPYGVFGSLWKQYGAAIAGSKLIAERLDTTLVSGIDAEEAGVVGELDAQFIEQWSLSEILEHNFIDKEITGMSEAENYESFSEAVSFAQDFLVRAIAKERDVEDRKIIT